MATSKQESRASERLLTVKEAASEANCHEESIRRAYLCGHLLIVRFGARGIRIREQDLIEWIHGGMKTRPS